MKTKIKTKADSTATAKVRANNHPHYLRPAQLASRWHWHPESVRRALRERRIASIVISRCRLIPASEIEQIEREGFVSRAA